MAPHKQHHQSAKVKGSASSTARERDQQTIRLVNRILEQHPVDTAQLRKVAAVRGLVNNEVRARVWPILLGVDTSTFDYERYKEHSAGSHRDRNVVDVDVQRSLWSYTEGWSDAERQTKRMALQNILNAVVCAYPGDVYYYQGLNDIAAVLLFVAGEKAAVQMLAHLTRCHLRDCSRPTLEPVLELLGLLMPILREADEELHEFISLAGTQPFFALSWYITCFAHNVPSLQQTARLFDLLLSAHPLMPLYIAAVIMRAARCSILSADMDGSEVHRTLNNLPIFGQLTADKMAQQAFALYKRCPPKQLAASQGIRFASSVAVEAYLEGGHWCVPDVPPGAGHNGQNSVQRFLQQVSALRKTGPARAAAVTTFTLASLSGLAMAAFLMARNEGILHWQL
ncbi:hypothetical protein WJX72_000719 [[Myrmecia] bisecta]|uniref:Rab-GAP TBC domain-containing protein n=1 Tax=[Myrmecia] bisecta TaxID=41462 RepID=A0AAW1PP77_9CHLO